MLIVVGTNRHGVELRTLGSVARALGEHGSYCDFLRRGRVATGF